jgi:hypothetical protein
MVVPYSVRAKLPPDISFFPQPTFPINLHDISGNATPRHENRNQRFGLFGPHPGPPPLGEGDNEYIFTVKLDPPMLIHYDSICLIQFDLICFIIKIYIFIISQPTDIIQQNSMAHSLLIYPVSVLMKASRHPICERVLTALRTEMLKPQGSTGIARFKSKIADR